MIDRLDQPNATKTSDGEVDASAQDGESTTTRSSVEPPSILTPSHSDALPPHRWSAYLSGLGVVCMHVLLLGITYGADCLLPPQALGMYALRL